MIYHPDHLIILGRVLLDILPDVERELLVLNISSIESQDYRTQAAALARTIRRKIVLGEIALPQPEGEGG